MTLLLLLDKMILRVASLLACVELLICPTWQSTAVSISTIVVSVKSAMARWRLGQGSPILGELHGLAVFIAEMNLSSSADHCPVAVMHLYPQLRLRRRQGPTLSALNAFR